MTGKRGRPKLSANSIEEALAAVRNGTAPKRPRNEHERVAAGKRIGMPRSDTSPTNQAAMLAKHYIDGGMQRAEAVRRASVETLAPGAAPIDPANIRKYLKRLHPTVVCRHNGGGLFAGFPAPAPENRPLLVSVEEVFPE